MAELRKTRLKDAVTGHTQGTDTALGTLGTKNPPIDADKVIYRNSASADALVTSTWTQIKAFLKTYFDTLYSALSHTHILATAQLGGDYTIAADDTWESALTTGAITVTNGTPVYVVASVTFQDVSGVGAGYQSDVRITVNGSAIIGAGTTWVLKDGYGTLAIMAYVADLNNGEEITIEVRRKATDLILAQYDSSVATQLIVSK